LAKEQAKLAREQAKTAKEEARLAVIEMETPRINEQISQVPELNCLGSLICRFLDRIYVMR
jgi:hypothetical protein